MRVARRLSTRHYLSCAHTVEAGARSDRSRSTRPRSTKLSRRVFISYQHRDHGKASGFNLLRWNRNVDLEVSARHLLSPVDSRDPDYISRKIREQIHGTSVTVVLVGRDTADSDWIRNE